MPLNGVMPHRPTTGGLQLSQVLVAPGPGHLCGGVALMRGSDGPETATGYWDSSSLAFTVSHRSAGTTTRRAFALPRFSRHALFPFSFRLRVRRVTERWFPPNLPCIVQESNEPHSGARPGSGRPAMAGGSLENAVSAAAITTPSPPPRDEP